MNLGEKDEGKVMGPVLGSEIDCTVRPEPESGPECPARTESSGSDLVGDSYVSRIRPSEANGFAVYTRNKRLKSRGDGVIGFWDKPQGNSGSSNEDVVSSNGGAVLRGGDAANVGGIEGNLGNGGFRDGAGESEGEMMELEVVEFLKAALAVGSKVHLIYTRSRRRSKNEELDKENVNSGDLQGLGSEKTTMEMKMSKKIRVTTVRELFETGLLEGYPVYYNGGKTGLALRGTIKDSGILCSCSLCKGARIIAPCQFEIHACKSYRRASQYICFENGKSLLDLVKECQKSSVKTLEETIQNFVGPMPEKESVICRDCGGSFLATSAAKVELLCDSCMITVNSEVDAECVKSRLSNSRSSLESLKVGSPPGHSKRSLKITKKDQTMHKLVFEDGGLPDGTEVAYYSHGKKLRDGYKLGSGILCRCCRTLVSPSQFEAHAGWGIRRKPYMYIYTSNGVSLHEFAISLVKGRKSSVRDSDDLCSICADGGKLVLCDGCTRAFHKECASLSSVPHGKWYCTYCENKFQRERFVEWNANAVAAGRVSGVDSIEQITNHCIRTVKNPEEAEIIACVICRGYDFSTSGFGPRTVILCDQCEKEYHVGCLKKHKIADLKELPKGKWFCSANCECMYSTLQDVRRAGAENIPDSSLDIIKKKLMENSSVVHSKIDVRWRLLSAKAKSRETRVLLSQAVAIFHDRFGPIVDSETGRDFIPSMVYGRNVRGQDFSGMYCAILTMNSTVVSAGILRIFGQEIAELPLAATRVGNQGNGYFQVLFNCIEKLLAFLKVKTVVLPATDEAKSIWTEKFRFKKIPEDQLLEYRKICWQITSFKGTTMLERAVRKCRVINQDKPHSDVPLQ